MLFANRIGIHQHKVCSVISELILSSACAEVLFVMMCQQLSIS